MSNLFGELNHGCRRILDALVRNGPCSRAELAALTGFSRPAVTQIIQELTAAALLEEQPPRRGSRGQPAKPVMLRGSAGFAVGVNFSTTYIELAAVTIAGEVVGSMAAPLKDHRPEGIAAAIMAALPQLLTQHGLPRHRLIGMGIAVPGDFDSEGALLPHYLFPGLRAAGLDRRFSDLLGIEVDVDNDGLASAIGERLMGVGREYHSFMLVHLGHGVGGGLIIDGMPYRGALGNAGILGQFYPYGQPRPSGLDLIEALRAAGCQVDDFDGLDRLPKSAIPLIERWIVRAAAQLSGDLARVSRFFGPEAVVIAGRLPPAITTALAAAIDFESVLRPLDDLPIVPVRASTLGSSAGAIGAASLPMNRALLLRNRP